MADKKSVSWKEFIKSGSEERLSSHKCPDDICFYGHTGGTTGFPKSVLLTNQSFNAVTWQYVNTFPHKLGDPFLSLIVPFVTYGSIVNIHMPLCLGLELVLIPKFNSDEWSNYFKKYKPVHMCAIPAYIAPMADDPKVKKMDLSFLQTVGMGGEGMNTPLELKINSFLSEHGSSAKLLKGYGMTEVCATASTEQEDARNEGSVGVPFIHNNFMVYDNEHQMELPYNTSGEICMQCESMMVGYLDNAEETDRLVKTHADGSKWIHTGDIGYIDEDGFIFVEGRMKRMIMTIHDGIVYKIVPTQTEEVLAQNIHVKDSCVVGLKLGKDIGLKAFVIKNDEMEDRNLMEELKSLCNCSLGENQIPDAYEFLNEFPRTAAGKVDYRKLENMCEV